MNSSLTDIEKAEKAFTEGDFDLLKSLLPSLLEKENPAAIRLNASFFEHNLSADECDRLYIEGMFKAAELGDLKAKYQVGVLYDTGEYSVPQDKVRASHIFKELAELGDPHCMWIYACELIWGTGSFPKATPDGLELLSRVSELGSADASITIARFYDQGEFNFEKDMEQRNKYRRLALRQDDTIFDPFI